MSDFLCLHVNFAEANNVLPVRDKPSGLNAQALESSRQARSDSMLCSWQLLLQWSLLVQQNERDRTLPKVPEAVTQSLPKGDDLHCGSCSHIW